MKKVFRCIVCFNIEIFIFIHFNLSNKHYFHSTSLHHKNNFYFNSVEYVFKYSTKSFVYNFELTYFDFIDTLNVVILLLKVLIIINYLFRKNQKT